MRSRPRCPPAPVLFDFRGVLANRPRADFENDDQQHGLPVGFLRKLNRKNNAWARHECRDADEAGLRALFKATAAGHLVDARGIPDLLEVDLGPKMVEMLTRGGVP